MNTLLQSVINRSAFGQGYAKAICCALLLFLLSPGQALAGGGPETTLLVVNADSPLSLRIANEYVQLRDIPTPHLLWLHGVPSANIISIALFREKIWQPISEFIRVNNLEEEIDLIVYSADFPYGVNFSADLKARKQPKNKYIGKIASLTSLTYFARRVALGDTGYLDKNHYFRDFSGPRKKTGHEVASAPRLTEKEIEALRKESRQALKRKEYDAAVGIYRKLLDSHPQLPENWHDLARGLAAAGKETEALTALTNAVDNGWSDSLTTNSDAYLSALKSNPAFAELIKRMETAFLPIMLSHGFRNHYVWSDAGLTSWNENDFKDRYFLSTLLAYTGIRGNSFPEVMRYLRAAAASDGTQPDGTVYLMENNNIRSKTRRHLFPTTLHELARRGRRGEVLSKRSKGQNGIVPVDKSDIIGLVVGSPSFNWEKSRSRLLPGAIAESLTSYGGSFNSSAQTKLTEFLRQGAAGSSGAVAEPYALQQKFPVPMLHSNYADGCSLAEAFYQSVEFPYQLIIVGDPLARPFAQFAQIGLDYPDARQPWSGRVSLMPSVHAPAGSGVKAVELWVNGQYLSSAAAGENIDLDTQSLANGTHQLRLVAVEDSTIETRSYARFDIRVANGDAAVAIDDVPRSVSYGEDVAITGSARAGSSIALFQGERKLGEATPADGRWRIVVPSTKLGLGPVSLLIKATLGSDAAFRSANLELLITEPERLPAITDKPPSNRGLSALIYDEQGGTHRTTIEQLKGRIKIPSKKRVKIDRVSLSGLFNVTEAGFYQFVISTSGQLRVSIDNRHLLDVHVDEKSGERFLPLSLQAGWHSVQIELQGSRRNSLSVVLAGDQPPAVLGGDNLGH